MKISVLMALYNEPIEWIEESLNSILNQTFKDFEIIVINDNPQRLENFKIIQTYEKKFKIFKYVNNEKNLGLTKSLNIGLKMCEGEYVARMDADDISLPNRFQEQVKFMDSNKSILACGTAVEYFGKVNKRRYFSNNSSNIKNFFFIANPYNTPIAHPSAIIRRKILNDKKIKYDSSYRVGQDYKLWYDLLKVGEITNIQTILLKYRTSELQISSTKKVEQINVQTRVFLQHVNKLLNSCYDEVTIDIFDDLSSKKKSLLEIISKNELNSLQLFVLQNLKSEFINYKILIRDIDLWFNKDILVKEKIKGLLNVLKKK